ncbi:hypothetical protein AB0G02_28420, partial [Actinosynnema sp. NPDC023658]|uniref:hypothetical protein n=1 Tax=Actinosynnema sp. NPDC023658 TaxID=3155465 RepID=UPI0033F96485
KDPAVFDEVLADAVADQESCGPFRVVVSKKSQARSASAWERRKVDQVVVVRSGAGSIPASLRICQTMEAATAMPRTRSSPWMRR